METVAHAVLVHRVDMVQRASVARVQGLAIRYVETVICMSAFWSVNSVNNLM